MITDEEVQELGLERTEAFSLTRALAISKERACPDDPGTPAPLSGYRCWCRKQVAVFGASQVTRVCRGLRKSGYEMARDRASRVATALANTPACKSVVGQATLRMTSTRSR
jgi:hypothetical protein